MPKPEESWTDATKDIVARLELCAKMDMKFIYEPSGCAALAKLLKKMASVIDNEIDKRNGER